MKRIKLLKESISKVTNTSEYGSVENNFQIIADFWNVYITHKYGVMPQLTSTDVALMMDLLKTSRLIRAPGHLDSWVDKAGYAACGAEVSNA